MLHLALFICNLRYIALLCSSNCGQKSSKDSYEIISSEIKTAYKNL